VDFKRRDESRRGSLRGCATSGWNAKFCNLGLDLRQDQSLVMMKLEQQAADRSRSFRQLLDILSATVPEFVALVAGATPRG